MCIFTIVFLGPSLGVSAIQQDSRHQQQARKERVEHNRRPEVCKTLPIKILTFSYRLCLLQIVLLI